MQKRLKKLKNKLHRSKCSVDPIDVSHKNAQRSRPDSTAGSFSGVVTSATPGRPKLLSTFLNLSRRSKDSKANAKSRTPGVHDLQDLPKDANLETVWTIPKRPPPAQIQDPPRTSPNDDAAAYDAADDTNGQDAAAAYGPAELGRASSGSSDQGEESVSTLERPSEVVVTIDTSEPAAPSTQATGKSVIDMTPETVSSPARRPRRVAHATACILEVASLVAGMFVAVVAIDGVFGARCPGALAQPPWTLGLLGGSMAALLTVFRAIGWMRSTEASCSSHVPHWHPAAWEALFSLLYSTVVLGPFVAAHELLGAQPGEGEGAGPPGCLADASARLLIALPVAMQLAVGTTLCLICKAGLSLYLQPHNSQPLEEEKTSGGGKVSTSV